MSIRDFQEQRRLERLFFSVPTLLAIGFLVLLALWGVWRALETKRGLDAGIAKLQKDIAGAQEIRDRYSTKIAEINTPAGFDREARDHFNLKKPGEEVVIFLNDAVKGSANTQSGLSGTWNAIVSWFNKIF